MKNIRYNLLLLLGTLWITSCNNNSQDNTNPEQSHWNSKYAVDNYYIAPDELYCENYNDFKSSQMDLAWAAGELPENTLFLLGFNEPSDWWDYNIYCGNNAYKTEEQDIFEKIAAKFGELGTANLINAIGMNISLSEIITDIKVVAVSDFNANYPSGSDISEIAHITYNSYYPFIQNNYVKTDEMESFINGGSPRLAMDAIWYNTQSFYDTELPKDNNNPIILPAVKDRTTSMYFASVSFTEKPAHDEIEFDVTLTYESGKIFNSVFTIDGIELN